MPTFRLEAGALVRSNGPGPTEITLREWREGARPEGGAFALALPGDAEVAEVGPFLSSFATVILEFAAFKDGRAYSQARLIRERFGFGGDVCARGEVLRDQLLFMARAGFNTFEIEETEAGAFSDALKEFSCFYQAGADGSRPVWRRRALRAAAA